LDLFQDNEFKKELINKNIPPNGEVVVYRCGDFADLCTGPHLRTTGLVKAFSILKSSQAYWLGNQ
jgi:threonyl-tRNA synthetase